MSWVRLECYGKDTKALSYCTFVHYNRATRDDVIMHLEYIIWVTLLVCLLFSYPQNKAEMEVESYLQHSITDYIYNNIELAAGKM